MSGTTGEVQQPLLGNDSAAVENNGATDIQDQLAQRRADMEARRNVQAAASANASAAAAPPAAVAAAPVVAATAASQPPPPAQQQAQPPPPAAAQANTFQQSSAIPDANNDPNNQPRAFQQPHERSFDREAYNYEWQVDMLHAPLSDPGWCITGCFCPCCFSYKQRKDILLITGQKYKCCGGNICGCDTGDNFPEVPCLCLETFCCPFNSIMINRYMIRDMYQLQLDPCDEYLITCAVIISWLVCLLQLFGIIDQDSPLEDAADCFIASVMSCSLTQNQKELSFHNGRKLFDCDFDNYQGK